MRFLDARHSRTSKPAAMEKIAPDDPGSRAAASLEPENWEEFRRLAHAALEDAIAFVQSVRERPVWQPVSESAKAALAEELPMEPQGLQPVYRDFLDLVFPYSGGNIHPRYFGWVQGAGLPSGIIAEMMAAAMNANCGGRDHAGLYVERVVINWCKAIFRFPADASGVLLTGTSMANLTGLTDRSECAELRRHAKGRAAGVPADAHRVQFGAGA